ncbi:hypothetical protein BSKO_10757 [Bryopsis sp. KO-2023]|nr:hypothetical protein BSKO_10757 [Bryopsis sp. KO-2023]
MISRNPGLGLAAFVVLALCGTAFAQKGISINHPLTNLPKAGELSTVWVLPDHPSKEFPAGEYVPILVGVHNGGKTPYNVSFIMGSLNLPQEFSYYVQNFTLNHYWSVVKPEEEATFQYKFRPDKSLSPMELRVALTVFYQDDKGTPFSSTFFNETIDIVEVFKAVDYEAIMMLAVMIAIFAGAAYGILAWMGNLSVLKKVAGGGKKQGGKVETTDDDWLQGTPYAKKKTKEQKPSASGEEKKTM